MRFPINGEDTFSIEAGITLKTHLVERALTNYLVSRKAQA